MAPWVQKASQSMFLRPFVDSAIWYSDVAKKRPFITGFITTGFKTTAADIFAQKVMERREEMDWRRNATFTAFGFMYLGGFQYFLYNKVFQRLCHHLKYTHGQTVAVGSKVFLDQALHHPFMYFPVFYSIKALAYNQPVYEYATTKYKNEIWDTVRALWCVWVPAQVINFSVVPMHFRIPYVAGVSFLWTVILSVMQGIFDTSSKSAVVIEEVD